MIVLVAGGREFNDRDLLFATLDKLHTDRGITWIVHGDAPGADRLADEWAQSRGVERLRFPADWRRYGRGAGPVRNKQMLAANPDLVVTFPGGRGTANMATIARKAGIEVLAVTQAQG